MSFVDPIVESDLGEVAEIRIDPITSSRSLYSRKHFKANEFIVGFISRATHTEPNYLTVQVSENVHIELLPECLECMNNNCDPNCFFDTTTMRLVTLKPLAPGDEMTFFYPSAEWDMDRPFECNCGAPDCVGMIQGAKYLSASALKRYRFTDFIRRKLVAR
ncbi:MAG TPA: SET domain-containing protein-lysine N-methyltransferase [Cyclobacteriaceae bacterium]|nr:SET domain-containing protein-lysine N-methyltransferase [Cyclobacteriaceae bacterium]